MLEKIFNQQYRRPSGLLGLYVGRRMARDHRPENLWTLSLLKAQPADHILEIGFGSGIALQELAEIVTHGHIAGVDYSKTMVRAVRRRQAQAIQQGRMDIWQADAASLPFEDNTFDKAFTIHSIYFWPQPLLALQSVWRVLKPEGLLALTVLPKEKWPVENSEDAPGTPDCKPYSGDELICLLKTAGFSETRIVSDSNPTYLSNFTVMGIKAPT